MRFGPRDVPAWLPWLALRSVAGLGTVLALSVIVFVATQALPSDPARVVLGPDATEEAVRILQRKLGLDLPLWEQYLRWQGAALHGDFGVSLDTQHPVNELLRSRFANTLTLVLSVAAFGIPLALGLGIALATQRHSRFDRAFVGVLIAFKAVPVFAIGIGLVFVFSSAGLGLLPAVAVIDPSCPLLSQLEYLVLPVVTLLFTSLPYPIRLVRSALIGVLESDYIVAARLRGISEPRLLWRHALPNALLPALQGGALMLSVMLGGALVVEVLFNVPGIGSALDAAVGLRDLPVIQALVLVIAASVVAINLGADLLAIFLTPRLRTRQIGVFGWRDRANRSSPAAHAALTQAGAAPGGSA
ncbi:MAG: ABC transporter permease [Polyangiaceae bacterium]